VSNNLYGLILPFGGIWRLLFQGQFLTSNKQEARFSHLPLSPSPSVISITCDLYHLHRPSRSHQTPKDVRTFVDVRGLMLKVHFDIGGSVMLEKLLLAVGLTLSLHVFAGVNTSPKLPQNHVMRSNPTLTQFLKLPLVVVPMLADIEV
jgi:hypothetical protein